ncbi:SIS domain-containing protein [Nocardioides sp. YIM 152588]|uniref:SIS domain-containing protein n=1 Tax=Nocardioides sp. YIM 152588 TaxID=3158259 RepID=UPI0032E37BD3
MKPDLFLADLQRKPEALRALAGVLREGNPWAFLGDRAPERVVLLGMGSSTYAAGVAAARLRARGITAVAELASSDLLPAWGEGTLVVAISASGGSKETLDALTRLAPGRTLVALTNVAGSPVTAGADHTVLMEAGAEEGGVACRSYQHTLALLLALEAHLTGETLDALLATLDRTVEATEHLLATEDDWRPEVARLLDGPTGCSLAAPARRLGSAQQSALMLREGPRRGAIGCESGDWAHVDVYLTKNTDYRLLSFAGSAWDDGILEWTVPRGTTVVSVGGELGAADGTGDAATSTLRYPHDTDDDVRLLTETLVVELVAARLWLEG